MFGEIILGYRRLAQRRIGSFAGCCAVLGQRGFEAFDQGLPVERLAQEAGCSRLQGPFAIAYQDARTTLDVNLSYQAFKRLSVFVNSRNVTNVHFNQSRYQDDTPEYARRSSSNSYGAQWAFGVKGTF